MVKRLLVLDDDPAVGATVVRLAKRLGFPCSAIQSGSDLPKALEDTQASVLLLDLSMPDMSGVDIIEQLATLDAPPALVLLSGMDKRVLEAASRSAALSGLQTLGWLTKPFGSEDFEKILRSVPDPLGAKEQPSVEGDDCLAGSVEIDPVEIIQNAEVWFQPQVSAEGAEVVGFEALGRFRLKSGEHIDTESVISHLKRRDYLNRYTKILIDRALEFGVKFTFGSRCAVAINVCASQFTSSWLNNYLRRRCDELGADPSLIVLEVTETENFSDESAVLRNLTALRIDGFRLAVDDFGTGHSTFSRIADFPFTDLKIDRCFVAKMLSDDDSNAIVTSLLELSKKFGLTVTAEGVGNRETAQKLASLGCDVIQGYLISVPLPSSEAAAWLRTRAKSGGSHVPHSSDQYGVEFKHENSSLTVCLVDDDTAIRQNMMTGLKKFQIDCRPYASGEDFLDGLQDVEADAYLIDLRMPEMDGLQTLARIPQEFRAVPAIMFSGHGEISKAVEAMKHGAVDFIEKPATLDLIAAKIRSAINEAPNERAPATQSREAQELLTKLTPREREVVLKVSEGKKNSEIAAELGIGKRTIEVHRTNIYSKLGVRNAVELTNLLQMAGVRAL